MSGKIREPMQETTSYSDNGYNVTNCFGCFEKFLAYTYSFQVSLLSDTKWQSYSGGRAFCPPSNIGVSQTLSKIGLKLLFLQNDFYVYNIFRPSTCHLLKLHQDINKFYSFRIVSSFQNFDLNFSYFFTRKFHLNKQYIPAILLSKQIVVIGDKSKIQSCRISLHKRSVMPPVSRCVNCN